MAVELRRFGELFAEPPRNGLTRPKAVRGTGVKMVNMGELFAHPRLNNAPMDRVPLADSEAQRFLLRAGDLLFARQSLVLEGAGKCSIFLGDDEPVTFESHVTRLRLDPNKADPSFYFYYLQSHHGRSAIASIVEQGAGASGIRGSDLEHLRVLWHNLAEQRAIAHILGTLDDKIELNRRMSETLEAMARALFQSWFVDFDPVRAKAEGRDPGLPQPLADLFPARLVDSELGEIPEGWEVKRLSDICSTQYGYTASAISEPVGPKFLRVTDINKRNWIEWGDVPHCTIDSGGRKVYSLAVGDLVVARMADPGKSAIIEEDIDAVFASYLVRLKTPSLAHSYYVYGFLKSELYAEYAQAAKSGSVQANMNARVIVGATLVVPPQALLECFLRLVLPLRRRLTANLRVSRTLAALRDALLPKLISGELRVKDAEKYLQRAGA